MENKIQRSKDYIKNIIINKGLGYNEEHLDVKVMEEFERRTRKDRIAWYQTDYQIRYKAVQELFKNHPKIVYRWGIKNNTVKRKPDEEKT